MKSTLDEMQSLEGQSVLITGGTTGIGRAIGLRLLQDGAHILIFGRQEEELNDALSDMKAMGSGKAYGILADQSRTEDIKRVFDEVDKHLGGLDILINNAAISASSVSSTPLEDIRAVIDINITGLLQCSQQALKKFRGRRGQIINIGSMSDTGREKGSDIYVATKAAVNGFTESLRKEANERGVRVSLIEPGLVGSDMASESTPPEEQPEKIEEMTMLKAEDIAEAVRYVLVQPERCDIVSLQIRPHKQSSI